MITDISRELVLLEQVQRLNYNSTFIIGTSDPCTGMYCNNERLSNSLKEYTRRRTSRV